METTFIVRNQIVRGNAIIGSLEGNLTYVMQNDLLII